MVVTFLDSVIYTIVPLFSSSLFKIVIYLFFFLAYICSLECDLLKPQFVWESGWNLFLSKRYLYVTIEAFEIRVNKNRQLNAAPAALKLSHIC